MQRTLDALIAELVECAYVAAVSPEKAGSFISLWADFVSHDVVGAPQLRDLDYHLRQCQAILRRSKNTAALSDAAVRFVNEHIGPACLVDEYGMVMLGNDASAYVLGLQTGANLKSSQLAEETALSILAWVKKAKEKNSARLFLDEESDEDQQVSVLVRRVHLETESLDLNARVGACAFLITAVDMQVGDNAIRALVDAFGLSMAEAAVAKALCNGRQAADIADDRGASINTVRSQIKSILKKMPAKGISDLVRIVWSFSATLQRHPSTSDNAPASNDNQLFPTSLSGSAQNYDVLVFPDLCDDVEQARYLLAKMGGNLSYRIAAKDELNISGGQSATSSFATSFIVSGSGCEAALPHIADVSGTVSSVALCKPGGADEVEVRQTLHGLLRRSSQLVDGGERFIVQLLKDHPEAMDVLATTSLSDEARARLSVGLQAIAAADFSNVDLLRLPNLEETAISALSSGGVDVYASLETAIRGLEVTRPETVTAS